MMMSGKDFLKSHVLSCGERYVQTGKMLHLLAVSVDVDLCDFVMPLTIQLPDLPFSSLNLCSYLLITEEHPYLTSSVPV